MNELKLNVEIVRHDGEITTEDVVRLVASLCEGFEIGSTAGWGNDGNGVGWKYTTGEPKAVRDRDETIARVTAQRNEACERNRRHQGSHMAEIRDRVESERRAQKGLETVRKTFKAQLDERDAKYAKCAADALRLHLVLARTSLDLAGGDARAEMVKTAIDLALAVVVAPERAASSSTRDTLIKAYAMLRAGDEGGVEQVLADEIVKLGGVVPQ